MGPQITCVKTMVFGLSDIGPTPQGVYKKTYCDLPLQPTTMAAEDSYVEHQYVEKPLPLITPCMEFKLPARPPLPALTACTEFKPHEVIQHGMGVPQGLEDRALPRFPSTSSPSPPEGREEDKIPKPRGEPGKPGSGGFSIKEVLTETCGWTGQQVENLQVRVHLKASRQVHVFTQRYLK